MSATAAGTDLDLSVLEELDFELPCDIKTNRTPCHEVATWILTLRPHCGGGVEPPEARLICEHHYQYVINGGCGFCTACKTVGIVLRDFIVGLERIKP